ncbi:unnamed protein product [Soboliphyme baturini]|uniref:MATH domain-containing protein n=1 Tax=Soboliphyme baturini TaxID=241478 RepID=A0A183IJK4_9BILA|nr:unnamed protein product [Soboliphyme baturini]
MELHKKGRCPDRDREALDHHLNDSCDDDDHGRHGTNGNRYELSAGQPLPLVMLHGCVVTVHHPSVNSPVSADNNAGVMRTHEMAEDEDDDYKAEATFQFEVTNVSKMKTQQLSPPVYVRGLPWKIMAMPRDNGRNTKHLGFFLQCNGESESA